MDDSILVCEECGKEYGAVLYECDECGYTVCGSCVKDVDHECPHCGEEL